MSLKRKLIKGGVLVAVATLVTSLLAYFFRFILIRRLPVNDYGLYYAIVSIFLFATTFIDMGRTTSFVKHGSEYLEKEKPEIVKFLLKYYYKFKLKTGAAFLLVVVLTAGFLAEYYFKDPRAYSIFIVLGIVYFFKDVFFDFIKTLYKTYQDQRMHSFFKITEIVLQVGFLLFFIYLGFGVWSPVWAVFLGSGIASAFFHFNFFKSYFPDIFKISSASGEKILVGVKTFAYANLFFNIGRYVLSYTDTYMLTFFTNLTEVGLYNVAVPTAKLVLLFSQVFILILTPLTASMFVKEDFKILNELINNTYKFSLISLFPLAIVLVSFPEIILKLLYGAEQVAATVPLQILSISAIFTIFFMINTNILNGIDKPKVNAYLIIGGGVFNVLLNFVLVPLYGMRGAAFSTMLGYLAMAGFSFYYLNKYFTHLKIELKHFLKILLSGIVFLVAVFFLKGYLDLINLWIESIIILLISGLIYLVMIFVTKALTWKEMMELIEMLMKD